MKQINNGYKEYYYIEEDGRVYNKETNKYISIDSKRSYRLKTVEGKVKRVALKTLYRLVYNRPYCIDKIEDKVDEEWKEIEGTKGNYYISNFGRIKSYNGYEALLMKPYKTKGGYERIDIVVEGVRVSKLVHRLTAASFLPVPKNIDMELHHKDENKLNNCASNLEWLTHKEHVEKHYRKDKQTNGEAAEIS